MFDISDEKCEELRLILEKQNGRTYTFEDVKEIGDELIDFYRLLQEFAKEGPGYVRSRPNDSNRSNNV